MKDAHMKSLTKTVAWLVLLTVLSVFRPPLVAWSQNQPNGEPGSSSAVQNAQTIKWRFGGNDAGSGSYTAHPDGTFESVTELNILGQVIKSRLTGKLTDGLITEFEMVTQRAGTEVKVSAKDGKAQFTVGPNSRTIDYK